MAFNGLVFECEGKGSVNRINARDVSNNSDPPCYWELSKRDFYFKAWP